MNDLGFSVMDWIGSLVAGTAVLRYLLQTAAVPKHNPLMKMAVYGTEFALQWIRPLLTRGIRRDYSPLLWAWFVNGLVALSHLSWRFFLNQQAGMWHLLPSAMALALVEMVRQVLYVWMVAVFSMALLSWVNPFSPLLAAVEALVHPFLVVLRRFLPPLGRVDLSPVVLMVFFQISLTLGVGALEMLVERLM